MIRVHTDTSGNSEAEDLGGGGLRVGHGFDPSDSTSNLQPEGAGPQVQTHNRDSRLSVTVRDGQYTEEAIPNHHEVSAADLRADRGPGILASARDAFGIPVESSRMNRDTLVTLPNGMEAPLEVAETMGYVSRDPNGNWLEVDPQQANGETNDDNTQDTEPMGFDDEAESTLRDMAGAYPPEVQGALAEAVISGQLEAQLNDFAAVGGLTPEALSEALDQVTGAFGAQADEVVRSMGVDDPQELYDWLMDNHPALAQDLMRKHVYTRNPSCWREAARRYLNEVPPLAEALRAAGYKVRRMGNGLDVVVVDGQEYDLETAAELGLV
ncbi:MAG TPA: hypothetical protein VKA48_08535 [Gammaproteobacteria bacterium]|nr:hypothetical protein [Gammaproteobacteria bacterium]